MQGKKFVIALFMMLSIATIYLLSLVPRRPTYASSQVYGISFHTDGGQPLANQSIAFERVGPGPGFSFLLKSDPEGHLDLGLRPGTYRAARIHEGSPASPGDSSRFVAFEWPPSNGTLDLKLP